MSIVKKASLTALLISFIATVGRGNVIATGVTSWPSADSATPTPTPMPILAPLPPGVINIILLGTDRRPPDEGWRTDVMILVSIDPQRKIASMVSIPRDLYVAIPGYGKTRLNLADDLGLEQRYPGGGPALLRATLEDNLGISFDHYIRIDFEGFIQMVDALGGIDVDVRCPTELWVPKMKFPGEYQLLRTIPAGMQHMDGDLALIFCRARAHTPVFDRDRRQREVLLAIRNRVLELGITGLLPRLFELLEAMQHNVQTDLDAAEILALAQLLPQIPAQNVNQRIIDRTLAPPWTSPQGAWVLLPDRLHIKEFMEGRLASPTWEESILADEAVRLAVDNGTTIEGFSFQMADRLRSRGYHVVGVGKAAALDHVETTIVSYTGDSFTLERLRQYLDVSEEDILYEPDWLSTVGISVILGSDAQPSCL